MSNIALRVVLRVIEEAKANKFKFEEDEIAFHFLQLVRQEVSTPAVPDRIELRSGIIDRPRLVAIKAQPQPYPKDAWGQEVEVDAVVIEKAQVAGYAGDGLFVFEHSNPKELEETFKREGRTLNFLLLTQPQQEEILEELHRYIITDVDDYRDTPLLGALYPLGMREDSPCPEWNALARQFHLEAERERAEWERKKEEEKREELRKTSAFLNSLGIPHRVEKDYSIIISEKKFTYSYFDPLLERVSKWVKENTFTFREGRDGRPISSERRKVILPARGFRPKVGEKWILNLQDRGNYYLGFPLSSHPVKEVNYGKEGNDTRISL